MLQDTSAVGSMTAGFSASTYATGLTPVSVAAAEISGDGLLDLIVANAGDHSVSLLVNITVGNSGSSPIALGAAQSIPVGANPAGVTITDANADGKADIVVANRGDNSVSVLLNTEYQTLVTNNPATGTIVHDYIFANGFE
jgi:hypothetical protein